MFSFYIALNRTKAIIEEKYWIVFQMNKYIPNLSYILYRNSSWNDSWITYLRYKIQLIFFKSFKWNAYSFFNSAVQWKVICWSLHEDWIISCRINSTFSLPLILLLRCNTYHYTIIVVVIITIIIVCALLNRNYLHGFR